MGSKHKVVNKYSYDQLGSRIHVNLKGMIDLRLLRGWSQEEMSDRIGINISSYQKIEQQVRIPSPDVFSRIIFALGDDSWLRIERTKMCCGLRTEDERKLCHVCKGSERIDAHHPFTTSL